MVLDVFDGVLVVLEDVPGTIEYVLNGEFSTSF